MTPTKDIGTSPNRDITASLQETVSTPKTYPPLNTYIH